MQSSSLKTLPKVADKSGWPWHEQTMVSSPVVKHLPKISIITPSFNQGQYLEETIRSIVLQNYPNYELIIIDAGSTDSTLDIIQKYEPWITYWVSEKDRGQSHAIRKGLTVATGDIINWINSDDLCAPGAFHRIAAEFDLSKNDVICGYCDYFVGNLDHLDLRNERMGLCATVGETMLGRKINQPSTFFKASILKELDVDEQYHYAMDLDLWYRYLLLAGQKRVLLSNSLFTYFRLHEASKSVAESSRFEGDIRKVFYNILYSLNEPFALLNYAKRDIYDIKFTPTRYPIAIDPKEISSFVLHFAWPAVHYYNEIRDFVAARDCITVARRNGQPMNLTMFRQLVKHALPTRLLHWLTSHPKSTA